MTEALLTVNAWLAKLDTLDGSGPLQLDDRGLLGLQTDSGLQIELEVCSEPPWLYLRAALRPLPTNEREAWYGFLLGRNFLCQSTGGAAFAIDAEHQQLALTWCQPLALLDAQGFADALMGFIDQAIAWSARLDQGLPAELDTPQADLPITGMVRA